MELLNSFGEDEDQTCCSIRWAGLVSLLSIVYWLVPRTTPKLCLEYQYYTHCDVKRDYDGIVTLLRG